MSVKSLHGWLDDIESRLKGESIQLGLERVSTAYQSLNLGERAFKVITVAGSNGKGSTVRLVESLLTAHGYQVGSFTSPHLVNFNERIKLNGLEVSDESIIQSFEQICEVATEHKLTYFEWILLAALTIFHQVPLDYVVLEVGLGGRLDAVNIIDSDISVITSISLDHQHFLGDTLSQIAKEKAGVMRRGCPVILGERKPQPVLIDEASRVGANVVMPFRDKDLTFDTDSWSYHGGRLSLTNIPYPALFIENALNALAVVEELHITLREQVVKRVIAETTTPGRQEWLVEGKVLCDVAHNEASVNHLVSMLKTIDKPIKLVFAMRSDKNYPLCFRALEPLAMKAYVAAHLASPSENITDIKAFFAEFKKTVYFYDVISAYDKCISEQGAGEVVVVCGSFQTVGAVKKARYTPNQDNRYKNNLGK